MFKGLFPGSVLAVCSVLTDTSGKLLCCPLVVLHEHYIEWEPMLCICNYGEFITGVRCTNIHFMHNCYKGIKKLYVIKGFLYQTPSTLCFLMLAIITWQSTRCLSKYISKYMFCIFSTKHLTCLKCYLHVFIKTFMNKDGHFIISKVLAESFVQTGDRWTCVRDSN